MTLRMDAAELKEFMDSAFGRPLGWSIERVDDDGVTVHQPTGADDLRPGGTVSGPTIMSLADGVAYMVVLSRIGPEALAVTSNLNINFLRRPRPGGLRATGRLLKVGRTLALAEVEVSGEDSDPGDRSATVAHAVVTYSLALLEGRG